METNRKKKNRPMRTESKMFAERLEESLVLSRRSGSVALIKSDSEI